MPKTKISEFSAIPGNNTDIDGINIAEGCPPSGINDAIRELMSQLKDFQAGTAGDSFNGPIGTTTPAAGVFTNLSASGTFALTGDQVQISEGGTGQTTANAAFNALAPSQSTHAGKYLKTDGTNTSWDALDISTADITGTLPIANGGTGLTALGTGVQTALGIAVGSAGAFVTNGGALGTPSSGTVTNLTGTASININGTVGATTPTTGAFTTLSASGNITVSGGTANGVAYLNGSKVLTTGSALTFDGSNLGLTGLLSISQNSSSLAASFINSDVTFGYGVRIAAGGTSATRYALVVRNPAETQDYFKISTVTGEVGHSIFAPGAPGSSEIARFTSTGLGIGTSSPGTKLDVRGSVTSQADSAYYRIRRASSADVGYVTDSGTWGDSGADFAIGASSSNLRFYTNNSATERMRLDSSGNLGIGTSLPLGIFNIKTSNGQFLVQNGTSANQMRISAFNNAGNANAALIFEGYSSEYGRFDSSGNLGLGVTPSASTFKMLQIGNSDNVGSLTQDPNYNDFAFGSNCYLDTTWKYRKTGEGASLFRAYGYDGQFFWQRAGSGTAGNTISWTTAMTLDASGNLGIGTTSPSSRLNVNGTITVNSGSVAVPDTYGFGWGAQNTYVAGSSASYYIQFVTNNTERARIDSSGNLLVGTTSNANTSRCFIENAGSNVLTVSNSASGGYNFITRAQSNGGTYYHASFEENTTQRGSITSNGSATAYNTSSDYRLKNIDGPLTGSGEFIDALKPKVGTWKTNGSKFVGFLAHEVQEVSPGSVVGTKDAVDEEGKPKYQAMEYGSAEFIANIIAELQSLRARVAQLEAK